MNNTNINRDNIQSPTSQSVLASLREPNSIPSLWKNQVKLSKSADKTKNLISQLQQQFPASSSGRGVSNGLHPFKIYQFPASMRRHQNSDDWQRVKVRDAMLGTQRIFGTDHCYTYYIGPDQDVFSNVVLKDGTVLDFQTPPSDGTAISGDGNWCEMIIPNDGNVYPIWISLPLGFETGGPTTPLVVYGTVTGDTTMTATSLWSGHSGLTDYFAFDRQANDPLHLFIANVQIVQGMVMISQLMYDNYNGPFNQFGIDKNNRPVMAFQSDTHRGIYDGSAYYFPGDIVQSTISYSGKTYLCEFQFSPVTSTTYDLSTGPITGINPTTAFSSGTFSTSDTTKTWLLLSACPLTVP